MRLPPSALLPLLLLLAAPGGAQPPAGPALPPAPADARHDAACSAALTESTFGLQRTAAFSVSDVAAARAFYRARGWRVLGGTSGYVLVSPDQRLRGTLASQLTNFRRIAADVDARGLQGYDHVKACTGIPDGTALLLSEHAG